MPGTSFRGNVIVRNINESDIVRKIHGRKCWQKMDGCVAYPSRGIRIHQPFTASKRRVDKSEGVRGAEF
jgi:hypothetical protein